MLKIIGLAIEPKTLKKSRAEPVEPGSNQAVSYGPEPGLIAPSRRAFDIKAYLRLNFL